MQISLGVGEGIAFLIIGGFTIAYIRGWKRLHQVMPVLARRLRLVAFGMAAIALTLALVWPLPSLSNYLLGMRSLQNVAITFIAVPFLWLAAPVHTVVWGVRGW